MPLSANGASSSRVLSASRRERAAIQLLPWNQLQSSYAWRSPVPIGQGWTAPGSRNLVSGLFQICFVANDDVLDLLATCGKNAASRPDAANKSLTAAPRLD